MNGGIDVLERIMLKLRNDPVLFVKEILGATPDEWQVEALNALMTKKRVAIRSGHG